MTTLRTLSIVALLGTFLAGCGADFTPGSKIERERVLGVRSEVAGDPSRAWPMPGETTQLTWLVADPAEPKPLTWMFAACVSATGTAAAPICDAEPFLITTGTDAPAFPLNVPEASALGEASVILVAGIVCADGTPVMTGDVPSCEGENADATIVSASVYVQRGADGNTNPDLANDPITLDGAAWPETVTPDSMLGCDVAGMPVVKAGSTSTIALTLDAADRDLVDGEYETLQLSHFATAGRLDRQFTILEASEQADTSLEVDWKAPGSAPASGLLVRVHLVLRDRRGGLDWATREVCVLP